jgi:hypothetical protein
VARAGYTSGPLFRASINGPGGPLSYDAAHHRWKKFIPANTKAPLAGVHNARIGAPQQASQEVAGRA